MMDMGLEVVWKIIVTQHIKKFNLKLYYAKRKAFFGKKGCRILCAKDEKVLPTKSAKTSLCDVMGVAGAAAATPTSLPACSGERAGSSIINQASSSSTCNISSRPTKARRDQHSGQKRS